VIGLKIYVENPETVLTHYEEKEIENVIDMLKVAQGVFGDSGLRCVYLLKAHKLLNKLIDNILESYT